MPPTKDHVVRDVILGLSPGLADCVLSNQVIMMFTIHLQLHHLVNERVDVYMVRRLYYIYHCGAVHHCITQY